MNLAERLAGAVSDRAAATRTQRDGRARWARARRCPSCGGGGAGRLVAALVTALVAMSIALVGGEERACACASAPGPNVTVSIASEEAVIVWDAEHHVEHFVRRASFETRANDFGFLVPTPTKPTLAPVDDALFARLTHALTPPIVHRSVDDGPQIGSLCLAMQRKGTTVAAPAPTANAVQVLDVERVGAYDAAVLQADDAEALRDWLDAHGYEARPALQDWLSVYVAKHWVISAFKIAREHDAGTDGAADAPLGTSAVRMTFSTDRPFFPYREPADARAPDAPHPDRLLRVFFFGEGRYDGAVGDDHAYDAAVPFSAPVDGTLLGAAIPEAVAGATWLTVFEDRATPRPGIDDLFFHRSASSAPVRPAPIEVIDHHGGPFIPLEPIVLLLVAAFFLVRFVTRRRAGG